MHAPIAPGNRVRRSKFHKIRASAFTGLKHALRRLP